MRIDLLHDKGLLDAYEFPERVAPTIRPETDIEKTAREHTPVPKAPQVQPARPTPLFSVEAQQSPKGLFIVLGILAVIIILGFLFKKGTLDPVVSTIAKIATKTDTIATDTNNLSTLLRELDSIEAARIQDSLSALLGDSVLPQDIFEQFLPLASTHVFPDSEMLTDNDSVNAEDSPTGDGVAIITEFPTEEIETPTDSDVPALVATKNDQMALSDTIVQSPPVQAKEYSKTELEFIANATMLKLASQLLEIVGIGNSDAKLSLNREKLELETKNPSQISRDAIFVTLKNVSTINLNSTAQAGRFMLTCNYENKTDLPLQFGVNAGDVYHNLDGLVGSFEHYLSKITIDVNRNVDDNPVKMVFAGNRFIIRSILQNWAEFHSNYILENLSLQQQSDAITLIADLKFIQFDADK